MHIVLSLAVFALMVGALVNIITSSDDQVRHLPKMMWIILVILLPLVGSSLWFAIGRERSERPVVAPIPRSDTRPTPERTTTTLSTEQQLAQLEREITAHEELERIRHLEAQIEQRRKRDD